jgi:hypothetical protein
LREAQAALSQADPPSMTPLMEGYCYHELASAYGDMAQRWRLIHSESQQPQAQRTVNKQLFKHSDREVKTFKKLCGTTFSSRRRAVDQTKGPSKRASSADRPPCRLVACRFRPRETSRRHLARQGCSLYARLPGLISNYASCALDMVCGTAYRSY